MKWKPDQLKAAIANKDFPAVVMVYGDDAGQVRELAESVVKSCGTDPNDPFLSDRISAEDISAEPGRLLESATTISFGGGLRLIQISGVNGAIDKSSLNAVTAALKDVLEADVQDVLVVVPAPNQEPASPVVKAVEGAKKGGAAIRCYQDNARSLPDVIRKGLGQKRVLPDAMAFLMENLGNDRAITQQELIKLDLYTGERAEVTLADCLASVANAPSVTVFKLCDAIALRDKKQVDQLLNLIHQEGEDWHFISTMVLRHLRRVKECQHIMSRGMNVYDAMGELSPPVRFAKKEFAQQVQGYPAKRLETLVERFYELQLVTRQGVVPPDLAAMRSLLGLSL